MLIMRFSKASSLSRFALSIFFMIKLLLPKMMSVLESKIRSLFSSGYSSGSSWQQ